jgi:hypothetical protein
MKHHIVVDHDGVRSVLSSDQMRRQRMVPLPDDSEVAVRRESWIGYDSDVRISNSSATRFSVESMITRRRRPPRNIF